MKKSLMLAMAIVLVAGAASAGILASDTFSYADGPLVGNSTWYTHSGTDLDLLVASGQAVVQHGIPSSDVSLDFVAPLTGDIYFSLDFSVDDLGAPFAGTDSEYFAHFGDASFGFTARVDVLPPNGAGDYTLGISTLTSTADVAYPTDMTFGVTYQLVARYSLDDNVSQLWIDPVAYTDASVIGLDSADPSKLITRFCLRQSDSSENETVRVDNLVVTDSCEDLFTGCPVVAAEDATWSQLKSLYR